MNCYCSGRHFQKEDHLKIDYEHQEQVVINLQVIKT